AVAPGLASLPEMAPAVFALACVDLRLARENGLDLMPRLLAVNGGLAIVVITAYADYETAVQAVKRGAWDLVPKPFAPAQIRHLLEKLLESRALSARLSDLQSQLALAAPEADFPSPADPLRSVGETPARGAAPPATAP